MIEILVATANKHKLREIERILKFKVQGAKIKVNEDEKTFAANAIKKARALKLKSGQLAIADDSGLEVKALNGRPGVRSARFAGPSPTPKKLCGKLLRLMKNKDNRSAQFICVIAIAYPDGKIKTVTGIVKGQIGQEMRGGHGFGYDPVFIPQGYKKTFAEMSPTTKNRLSHRGRALRELKKVLKKERNI